MSDTHPPRVQEVPGSNPGSARFGFWICEVVFAQMALFLCFGSFLLCFGRLFFIFGRLAFSNGSVYLFGRFCFLFWQVPFCFGRFVCCSNGSLDRYVSPKRPHSAVVGTTMHSCQAELTATT